MASEPTRSAPFAGSDPLGFDSLARAALVLAALETVVASASGFGQLLSLAERATYVLASVTAGTLAGLAGGVSVRLLAGDRGVIAKRAAAVAVGVFGGWVGWGLGSGRRVVDARWLFVAAFAGVAFALASAFSRWAHRGDRKVHASLLALALGLRVVDVAVLPRLYPTFHAALDVAFVALVTWSVARLLIGPGVRGLVAGTGLLAVAAPAVAWHASRAPNTSFVLATHARLAAPLVRAFEIDGTSARSTARPGSAPVSVRGAGELDLRGRSVLLISVDALRADRLRAYGGRGLTPAMDALADEGAVFLRAYTTTPHTSYALASMLTGKFLRPILELADGDTTHVALPERLQRYGYRTAAFYPPAIFFVDADRFRQLADDGFGFEYRKAMYAPAMDRVAQLEAYLTEVPEPIPVFAWVHLFEPHEPYDPPSRFRSAGGDETRYDGEVRAADEAIGELVRTFRRRYPDATVIVTADHGEEFRDHGGMYHGTTLYDEQVRVPLIWSSPGVVEPRVVEAPVEHVDIAVTLLAALGIPRDARMRGDDLGPALRGRDHPVPTRAFADIADLRMVTDGRFKAICAARAERCELYDVVQDPRERRNLAEREATRLEGFRAEIAAFVASIPTEEALAFEEGAYPPALARAALGDRTVTAELLDLAGDARPHVRADAIRWLGRFGHEPGLGAVRAALADGDERVRMEAAIASLRLGDEGPRARVLPLTQREDAIGEEAALALADLHDPAAGPRLLACASSPALDEVRRRACVVGLGRSTSANLALPLASQLEDVRLRPEVADALGALGNRAVVPHLREHLARERYVPSRLPLARALARLGDTSWVAQVIRYLGMESGMPGGVGLLLDERRGAARDVRGTGSCAPSGCPLPATYGIARPRGRAQRVIVVVDVVEGASVRVGETVFRDLPPGRNELALAWPGEARAVLVSGDAGGWLVGYAVVASTPEIPPPPPEPWDAGVNASR